MHNKKYVYRRNTVVNMTNRVRKTIHTLTNTKFKYKENYTKDNGKEEVSWKEVISIEENVWKVYRYKEKEGRIILKSKYKYDLIKLTGL